MQREDVFRFRVSELERKAIKELARQLQRTQSDAVRFVVINAARELASTERKETICRNAEAVR